MTKLTRVQNRLIDSGAECRAEMRRIIFQHTVLCQTCFPYRNPGDDVREWKRTNGGVHLLVSAGARMHRKAETLVHVGLPYGSKARMILMHLNQLALLFQSPRIELDPTLTAFVGRIFLAKNGQNIREVRDQLDRICAANMTLGMLTPTPEGKWINTTHIQVIENEESFFPSMKDQLFFWPDVINLYPRYFESLMEHAIPLNQAHIDALSHSALALDIYAWLAQRLHRVPAGSGTLLYWPVVAEQFGQEYTRIRKFREVFCVALAQVLAVYRSAKVEVSTAGVRLRNSPPPVPRQIITVPKIST